MSPVPSPFSPAYADRYDLLYRDKDYAAECAFLETAFSRFKPDGVRSILDLGCGTGNHALPLAQKGYRVVGVDRSPRMLETARAKARALALDGTGLVDFREGDICHFDAGIKFDAVVCLFAVLSYQVENAALQAALATARRHLAPGGIFLADFWHGPGVLTDPPKEKAKTMEENGRKVLRLTRPTLQSERNAVSIEFQLLEIRGDRVETDVTENHLMRYFFRPELELCLKGGGFALQSFHVPFRSDLAATEHNWNAMLVAVAHEG